MRPGLVAAVALPLALGGCLLGGIELEAEEGQWLQFYCVPYSPCATVHVESPEGAGGYRLTLQPGLRGGYAVDAERDGEQWSLSGYGFEPGQPGPYEGRLPAGALATRWSFQFAPLSGERGGTILLLVRWVPASDAS